MGLFAHVAHADIMLPLGTTRATRLTELKGSILETQQALPPDSVGYAALQILQQCLTVGQVRKRTLDEFPHAEHTSFLAIIFGSDGYQSKNPSKKHAPGFRV